MMLAVNSHLSTLKLSCDAALDPAEKSLWESVLPIQRFATVTEIAEAAYFLAHADYATGSCLSIDGGNTAGGSL